MKQAVCAASAIEAMGARIAKGFTLVELLIVVVIMSILATVGYGSYTGYVTKSHRQAAKNLLYQIADRQEQFFQDNRVYANQLTALGYAENTMALDGDGQLVPGSHADINYALSFAAAAANTFTVQIEPKAIQASRDAKCGTLSLTETGLRNSSGTAPVNDCW